jgi:hypothetical protein
MREPDVFLRHVRETRNGPLRRVYVIPCANSPACGGTEGGICRNCLGARLTNQEREFLAAKRIGEKRSA